MGQTINPCTVQPLRIGQNIESKRHYIGIIMKFYSHVGIRNIGKETVLVFLKEGYLDFSKVISLNPTALFLIEPVLDTPERSFTPSDWVERLKKEYSISEEQATADVQILIDQLLKAEVISNEA